MKKLLITAAFLSLTACVEVGPPNYNERDRRAYNSLREVDTNETRYDRDGYYYYRDGNRDRHNWHDNDDDHDDYNPHNGHDRWVRHSN